MPKLIHRKKRFQPNIMSVRRMALGLSVNQLADLIDCSHATVINWENGKYEPGPRWIPKIAKSLKIKVERLVTAGD